VFAVRVIQNTNSCVCTHTKHKYSLLLIVLGDSRKDINAGVCCESNTKHKFWCLLRQSYATQILVFVMTVIRNTNPGVCYDSHMQHKYCCLL
jgi:hypothetical protein